MTEPRSLPGANRRDVGPAALRRAHRRRACAVAGGGRDGVADRARYVAVAGRHARRGGVRRIAWRPCRAFDRRAGIGPLALDISRGVSDGVSDAVGDVRRRWRGRLARDRRGHRAHPREAGRRHAGDGCARRDDGHVRARHSNKRRPQAPLLSSSLCRDHSHEILRERAATTSTRPRTNASGRATSLHLERPCANERFCRSSCANSQLRCAKSHTEAARRGAPPGAPLVLRAAYAAVSR